LGLAIKVFDATGGPKTFPERLIFEIGLDDVLTAED